MADTLTPLLESGTTTQAPKRSTLLNVCPFILGNEFCERLAFYGLATNLVTYISNVMGGDPGMAAIQVSMFEGLCFTTPLIGAFVADSFWGRYKTIFIFSLIYLAGLMLLTASSFVPGLAPGPDEDANTFQYVVLCSALGIIALGTGGIKPNVSAFGADQFNVLDPQDAKEKASFFGWFYLAINIGSFIACTAVVYVQDSISWSIGFAIPGVAMVLGIILFVSGSDRYRHVHPTESPMSRVVKVVYAALMNRWKKLRSGDASGEEATPVADTSSLHGAQNYGGRAPAYAKLPSHVVLHNGVPQGGSPVPHGGPPGNGAGGGANGGGGSLRRNKKGYGSAENGDGYMLSVPNTASMSYRWLEDAITEWQTSQGHLMQVGGGLAGYTPQQVEEVKLVLRLLPVFFTTVLYWTIYTQMGAMFVQQGNAMQSDFNIAGRVLHFPSASMSLFNTLAIILLIPAYDMVFEPLMRRFFHKITMLQRMGVGMFIAVIAMLMAAGVEMWRLQNFHAHDDGLTATRLGRPPIQSSELNIFWQTPQYFMIGVSEVFTSIGMLEFFYDQAPDVMRSCSIALCMLSSALGSYLSGALVAIVQVVTKRMGTPWLPADLNQGRLDLFFLLLAALMALNAVVYIFVACGFEYKAVEHLRPEAVIARAHSLIAEAPPGSDPSMTRAVSTLSPLPSRPPRYPSRTATAPMGIGRRPQSTPEDAEAEDLVYGRSLAYFPDSPLLPPNCR